MSGSSSSGERNALVTGAAGFVGQAVSARLRARGWTVVGLDRAAPAAHPASAASAFRDFWCCDLLDEPAVGLLAGRRTFNPNLIVHLAGVLPGRASRRDLFAVNVGGTAAVVDTFGGALGKAGHLILFSTGLVYGNQAAPFHEGMDSAAVDAYGQSKVGAEAVARAFAHATGTALTVLRPSVIYGGGAPAGMFLSGLMQTLRKGEPFAMTGGEQRRDFIHVDDVADAVAVAAERRATGTWNVGSGDSRTVRQAAELGAAIAGRPELLRIGALPYRANEVFDYRLDCGAIARELEWRATVPLSAGLERLWKEPS